MARYQSPDSASRTRGPRIPVLPVRAVPRQQSLPIKAIKSRQHWNSFDNEDSLRAYGVSYFKTLVLDYRSITNPQPVAVRVQLDAIVNKPGAPESWDDIYVLERGLVAVLTEAPLRALVPFLRSEFEASATSEEYSMYLRTSPPDAQNASVDRLRADAMVLVDQIQWRSLMSPFFERMRSGLLQKLLLWSFGYSCIAFALLLHLGGTEDITRYCYHLLVALQCGILGGAISTTQRIQALPCNAVALANLKSLEGRHIALFASPVVGGVSAMLLFFLCAGQVLPSSIFPVLVDGTTMPHTSLHVFASIGADDYVNAAKLVVWSFIAGFSERFIPDTVSRLTAKLSS